MRSMMHSPALTIMKSKRRSSFPELWCQWLLMLWSNTNIIFFLYIIGWFRKNASAYKLLCLLLSRVLSLRLCTEKRKKEKKNLTLNFNSRYIFYEKRRFLQKMEGFLLFNFPEKKNSRTRKKIRQRKAQSGSFWLNPHNYHAMMIMSLAPTKLTLSPYDNFRFNSF